jgi:cell division protein FtsB
MSQRIIALLLVLFSIVLITLGPSFIQTITLDSGELWGTINKQKTQIQELQTEVDVLNKNIRDNQRECTNLIVEREKEILEEIARIESRIGGRKRTLNRIEIADTSERVIRVIEPTGDMDMIMFEMKNLKNNINKDIENRGK